MNEEALKYSWELFRKDGYNGSIDEYKTLLKTNKEALDYSYDLFSKDGYNGKPEDYFGLMGLGQEIKQPIEQPIQQAVEQPKKKGFGFTNSPASLASIENQIPEQPQSESGRGSATNFLANLNRTVLNIPADIADAYAIASSFSERQLNKLGIPFTNPDSKAEDVAFLGIKPMKLADEYRSMIESITPVDEEFKSTFAGGVSQGLGQVAGMLLTGGGSRATNTVKAASASGSSITPIVNAGKELIKGMTSRQGLIGGSMNASANYRQAKEEGATEEQALRYGIENLVVGSIMENLPVQSMFSRIAKLEPNAKILDVVKNGLVGAGEEAVTEGFQTTYENMSANRIYDINKSMLDGVGEASGVGGTVGFIINASLSALMGRRVKTSNPEEIKVLDKAIEETKAKVETVEANNEKVKETVDAVEKVKLRKLNDGDTNLDFIETEDGIEYTKDGLDEKSANSIIGKLSVKYPNIEFTAVNNTSEDTYALADFAIKGKPKNAPVAEYKVGSEPSTKEDVFLRIESAENISDLEGVSITNDSELESALQNKVDELNKPVEEVKAEEVDFDPKELEFKADYDKHFEYVPIEEIEKYKEHDRETEKKWGSVDNTLNELTEEIKKEGIKRPITLQIDRNGNALVVEGNTRLAAAKRLGIKNIPVRVIREEFGSINKEKTKKVGRKKDISEMQVFYTDVDIRDQDNSPAAFGFNSITKTNAKNQEQVKEPVLDAKKEAEKINKENGADVYVATEKVKAGGQEFSLSQINENGNDNTFLIEDSNGNEIGRAQLNPDGNFLENIRVDESFRRKGLAMKLYDFIEAQKGIKLNPSPNKQSKEAKLLWDKRNKFNEPTAKPADVAEQPKSDKPRAKKPTVAENVPTEPIDKGTDSEVQVDQVIDSNIQRLGIKSEAIKPFVKRTIEKVGKIDVDNTFNLAEKIAKNDNEEIGVQHVAEALMYETNKTTESEDYFSIGLDDIRETITAQNKNYFPSNKERLNDLGLTNESYPERSGRLISIKEKYEALPDNSKTLFRVFIDRFHDNIKDDAKLSPDQYLDLIDNILKSGKIEDVAQSIYETTKSLDGDTETLTPVEKPTEKQPKPKKNETKQGEKSGIVGDIEDYTKAKLDRKGKVLKYHQYDLKVNFLERNGLSQDLIDSEGFNQAWNSGVLSNSNGIGLDQIAKESVKSAIENPKPFIEAYNKVNEKYSGKYGVIKDTDLAKKDFLKSIQEITQLKDKKNETKEVWLPKTEAKSEEVKPEKINEPTTDTETRTEAITTDNVPRDSGVEGKSETVGGEAEVGGNLAKIGKKAVFKISTPEGEIKDVSGQPVTLPGYESLDLFVHKEDRKYGEFVVTEKRTGAEIGRGDTAKEASNKSLSILNWQQSYNKEYPSIYSQVNQLIDKTGTVDGSGKYENISIPKISNSEKINILEGRIKELRQEVVNKKKESARYFSTSNTEFQERFIKDIEERILEIKNENKVDTSVAKTDTPKVDTPTEKVDTSNRVSFSMFGEQKTGTREGDMIIGDDKTKYRVSSVQELTPIQAEKRKFNEIWKDVKSQLKEDKQGIMIDFRARAEADIKFYQTLRDLVSSYVRLKGMQISEAIRQIEANLGKPLGKANTEYLKELGKDIKKSIPKKNVMSENKSMTKDEQVKQGLEEIIEAKSREAKKKLNSLKTEASKAIKGLKDKAKAEKEAFRNLKDNMISFIQMDIKDLPVNEFTKTEVNKILSQIKNAKTEYTVNTAIDKIFDILGKAASRNRVKIAKGLVAQAKTNIKEGKIGLLDHNGSLDQLLRVNPRIIPVRVYGQYISLLKQIGERKTVLSTKAKTALIQDATDLMVEVEADATKVSELSELYANTPKVIVKYKDENGKPATRESYSKTVEKLLQDGMITSEDAQLMKDRRSEILNTATEYDGLTEAEIEEMKQDAIADAMDLKQFLPKSGSQFSADENKVVRTFNSITEGDLQSLSLKKVKQVAGLMQNMSNGIIGHLHIKLTEEINGTRSAKDSFWIIPKYKGSWIEWISAIKAKVNKTSTIQEKIRRSGLYAMDKMLGNFEDSQLVKGIFWKLGQAIEQRNIEFNSIERAATRLLDKIPASDQWRQSSLITMIKLQRQREADNSQPSAKNYLEATLEAGVTESVYDQEALNGLKKIFDTNSTDGELDVKKATANLSDEGRALIDYMTDTFRNELGPKVDWGTTNVRGNRVPVTPEYFPTPSKYKQKSAKAQKEALDLINRYSSPSTKGGSFIAKTKNAHPITFDSVENLLWSTRETLLDYHMSSTVREVNHTIKHLAKMATNDSEKQTVGAITNIYNNVMENVLGNSFANQTSAIASFVEKKAYQALLGGILRPIIDFTSNVTYAGLAKGPESKIGMDIMLKNMKNKDILSLVAKNLKSVELTRMFDVTGLVTRFGDAKGNTGYSPMRGDQGWIESVLEKTKVSKVKDAYQALDKLADITLSSPDQVVSKAIYFGVLSTEFKKLTGKDIDLQKIADADQDYMEENFDALEKAGFEADQQVQESFSSSNEFLGIPRNQRNASKSGLDNWIRTFNGFMNKFTVGEYVTALTAVNAIMGNGKLTRTEGTKLLMAQSARLAIYSYLIKTVPPLIYGALLGGEDEEEKEKELATSLGSTAVQIFTTLAIQRNLGSWAKIPTDMAVEYMNMEFGEGITYSGEYDSYQSAVTFPIIPIEEPKITDDYFKNMVIKTAGPYSPLVKTTHDILRNTQMMNISTTEKAQDKYADRLKLNSVQLLGNLGMVPFYRDVNNILKQAVYQSERSSKKPKTESEKLREALQK